MLYFYKWSKSFNKTVIFGEKRLLFDEWSNIKEELEDLENVGYQHEYDITLSVHYNTTSIVCTTCV